MEKLENEDNEPPILADYLEEWIDIYKLNKVSEEVYKRYIIDYKKVRNFFGQKTMDKISRKEYQEFLNLCGKNRSKDTVKRVHQLVKAGVKDAMADGLINRDFTHRATLNYDKEPNTRPKVWNYKDAMKLLKSLDTLDLKDVMLYIALSTGLRIGEVYGLAYEDITNDSLSVNRGYDYRVTHKFTDGKNKSSIRTIMINEDLFLKVQQFKLLNQHINNKYLFLDQFNHHRVSHTTLRKYLKKKCKKINIEQLTIHSLRHTHCSILIYEGLDINYIAKRLGHSNTVETIQTYSHIIDELQQQENDKMAEVLKLMSAK